METYFQDFNLVKLVRVVRFSAGHRYGFSDRSTQENKRIFGNWFSPFSHGHNYTLEVGAIGPVEEKSGMVINIKTIDSILQSAIVETYDGKSLNDEVPPFERIAPTLENLLLDIRNRLECQELPPPIQWCTLKLAEMPGLYAELRWDSLIQTMTLTRSYEFAASHRLHSPDLTDEENLKLFGKCNNVHGHGHNYVLEVTVTGDPDPTTGMLVDLKALDEVIEREIVDRYDHRNLNLDVPEFADKNPTSEIVAQQIFSRLDGILPATLTRVRLYETARNLFEVSR
jgi:6-pyruvoyltetrahydropterin/6-carboxytetrahydropterin synthase